MTSFERLLSSLPVCVYLFRLIVVADVAIEREKLAIFFPAREARYSRQSKHNGPNDFKRKPVTSSRPRFPETLYYYYHFSPLFFHRFWVLYYYLFSTAATEI